MEEQVIMDKILLTTISVAFVIKSFQTKFKNVLDLNNQHFVSEAI